MHAVYLRLPLASSSLLQNVRVGNFFGGLPIKQQREQLKDKDKCPHVIVGTPGRVKGVRAVRLLTAGLLLVESESLGLSSLLPCRLPCRLVVLCWLLEARVREQQSRSG
jgi:hypothetical protein